MPALDGLRLQGRGRIPLAGIEAIVAARLGPGRVRGNAQPAAFSRQVAMYLASRVGKWSTIEIGKFYNGRDHSTVCYAIARIRTLRAIDEGIDGIVSVLAEEFEALAQSIGSRTRPNGVVPCKADPLWVDDAILDAVAENYLRLMRIYSVECFGRSQIGIGAGAEVRDDVEMRSPPCAMFSDCCRITRHPDSEAHRLEQRASLSG